MRLLLVWGLPVVLALGCSKAEPNRVIVSGTVTYLGQPIEDGLIRFVPLETGAGPMAGDMIAAGKYKVTAKGGVPVGECRVEIKAKKVIARPPTAEKLDLNILPDPSMQFIPSKYNTDSVLTVMIKSGGEVVQDFNLE